MDEDLRGFILNNLKEFPYLDLPITPKHHARLRRIVSSLRFASLDEWQATKLPVANPFYVHPDYIELPTLEDIHGQRFEPSMITRAENGLLLWTGIPEKTTTNQVRGARQPQYVLTLELANWFDAHKALTLSQMETILAPMSRPLIAHFMRRLTAHQAPNLQSWKEAKAPSSYMHHNYIKDGIITDALGRRYAIVSITHPPNGLMLLRGRPEHATHKNRQEVIITPELAALIEEHLTKGS